LRTFQGGRIRVTPINDGFELDPASHQRLLYGTPTMNLKNLDWKHIALITITVMLAIYTTLVAQGVPLPAQLAAVASALTSILNWLNASPVATPMQIATKATKADIRASMRPPAMPS
jgi:hypothetical protein